jgi:hypothetical protein
MPGPYVVIRAARESEHPLIGALEKSGEKQFGAAGMDRVADAPASEPDAYRPALADGRLLVAADGRDAPLCRLRGWLAAGAGPLETGIRLDARDAWPQEKLEPLK